MSAADNLYDFLKDCEWMPKEMEFAQSRKDSNHWTGTFTDMQREVLQSSEFWNPGKNIVIHGPTSSGKTLLAEIAALRQIVDPSIDEHKVLFLVPLRVLVTSQCRQFQRDFCNVKIGEQKLKIFESSADYQDHDAQILSGDYDIAVIVYEKFFSMLNNQNSMLVNCGLIVVDELQMLSSLDRGPKMEFSIMKVLETQQKMQQDQLIRIIGMTTSESGVDSLCRWLDAERLGNDIRPVALNQYFVSYNPANMGEYRFSYVPSADKQTPDSDTDAGAQEGPKQLMIPPAVSSMKKTQDADKKRCLFTLLKKWMEVDDTKECPGKKILIFNNAKRSGRSLAKEIASKFPLFTSPAPSDLERRKELKEILDDGLREFSDEEDVNELGKLISHGIAFHHSGLPSTIREAIEEDFRDQNGQIQVIVCTETLMIGVNLPADVVILYDRTVFRGASTPRKLSLQEYKNFIGRAGRLGFRNEGESYLLTDKLTTDFNYFSSNQKTEIVSPFQKGGASEIAPYFLSWIRGDKDVNLRIQQGLVQGFFCNQSRDDSVTIANFSQKILDCLRKLTRIDTHGNRIPIVRLHGACWSLTQLGASLAPYALTLDTDAILIDYVIKNRENLQIDKLQFQSSHKTNENPPGPLLELLYTICQCREVEQNPALQLLTDEKMNRVLSDSAKKYLRKVYPVRPAAFTMEDEDRPLAQLAHMQCVMETYELRAATRAIVLALWMAGCSIRTIRDSTNFNISISTSDVERLSESVAYLMEALSKCQECLGMDEKDSSGMRILSTSMKYGVPRSLVSLANTHARGVTRPFLLKIGEKAKSAGKTSMEYVLASTEDRYRSLREALREREHVHNYAQQLENKNLVIPDQFRELLTALQGLDTSFNQDCALNHQNLLQFFTDLSKVQTSDPNKWGLEAHNFSMVLADSIQVQFLDQNRTVQLYFQTLRPVLADDNEWTQRIEAFGMAVKNLPDYTRRPTRAITVLCGTPPAGEDELPADQLVISSEILGVLLLACLLEDCDDTNQLIYRVLSDLVGSFILDGEGFFNSYAQIWELVKGYSHREIASSDTCPLLYYYSGIFDYKHCMPRMEGAQYREYPWGRPASGADSQNIASFYHPAMRYSRHSHSILENSCVIFCNQKDLPEVQNFKTTIIPEKEPEKGMNVVLCELAELLRSEPRSYAHDVGISFRSTRRKEMDELYKALKSRGKDVLFMDSTDFEKEMAGGMLPRRLTEAFASCRHIVVCDTEDYDYSLYTMVEYNVVLDKLAYALKHRQKVPIYLIRIENVSASQSLSDCFRHGFIHNYRQGGAEQLADGLVQQMQEVERSGI